MAIKNIIQQTIIFATTLFIYSCSSNNEKNNQSTSTLATQNDLQQTTSIHTQETEITSTTLILSLDNFKGIPDEVDGCACYFSETDQMFKNKEYIFAAGFDSIGFVAVDNKLVKLKLISTEREPNTFGDYDHVDIYKSERYKVTVDIKYKNSNGDETWWNDGTLTIESKDGLKVTKKFVGECGC